MTQRTRSRNNEPNLGYYTVLRFGVPYGSGESDLEHLDEGMTDHVIPNYHQKIRRGDIVNNPMLYTVDRWKHSGIGLIEFVENSAPYRLIEGSGPVQCHYWGIQSSSYATWSWNYFPSTHDLDADMVKAQNRALANLDSTPYDFFEDLLEIRETIKFLRNPLAAIRALKSAYTRSVKKINRMKNLSRKAKALADAWNQYRFALAPLVRTIVQAADAYNHRGSTRRDPRRSAVGSVTSKYEVWAKKTYTLNFYTGGKTYFNRGYFHVAESKATILYEVTNPLKDWKFNLGLRAKDIPVVLWEVVPLSFLVDRLVNIKRSIQALVNLLDPNVTILAASTRLKDSRIRKHELTDVQLNSWTLTKLVPDANEREKFVYERKVWEPSISDITPGFSPEIVVKDVTNITDLLALTISRLL